MALVRAADPGAHGGGRVARSTRDASRVEDLRDGDEDEERAPRCSPPVEASTTVPDAGPPLPVARAVKTEASLGGGGLVRGPGIDPRAQLDIRLPLGEHLAIDLLVAISTSSGPGLSVLEPELDGWLYRVTSHLALKRLTRDRSLLERIVRLVQPPPAVEAADQLVQRSEDTAAALRAIDTLPPNERMVAMMVLVDGTSQTEIAQALGMSKGNVSKLMSRAREKLTAAGWEGLAGE